MNAHTVVILVLLAAGCTPEPAPTAPHDMGGDMAGSLAIGDLARVLGDMTPATCAWDASTPPISTGTMPISSAYVLGAQQCMVLADALYIDRRRDDRTEEQLYFYPQTATANGIRVFYRSIGDGKTLPEITCEQWNGTATITATPAGRRVTVDLQCSEINAGHHFWTLDMTPPITLVRGTFDFPN